MGKRVQKKANPRQLILRIFVELDKNRSNLDHIINVVLRGSHIDHRDRRFVFEIVYGILRHKATIDYTIDKYLSQGSGQKDEDLYRILRIGIYQLLYMNRFPTTLRLMKRLVWQKQTLRQSVFPVW